MAALSNSGHGSKSFHQTCRCSHPSGLGQVLVQITSGAQRTFDLLVPDPKCTRSTLPLIKMHIDNVLLARLSNNVNIFYRVVAVHN